jgi:hypothetical protein
MDPINEINRDADLVAALQQILPIVSAQKTTLNMTAQQVTDLTNLANGYIAQYGAMNTARAAAKSATASKDTSRRTMANSLYSYVKQWRANPAVSDALLAQLLCAPRNNGGGSSTTPNMPTDLTAFANGLGDIQLKWKPNGNKSRTVYLIQTRSSAAGAWTTIDAVTKTSYETSATPGEYIAFRLIATRGGKASNPSISVSLWENGNSETLRLAA